MYISKGTYGICDRCGVQFRLSELRKEWTGLMVCQKDFDPKPAQTKPAPITAEGVPVLNARPDNQDDAIPNTTTANDL